jgi:hypothetical protein
MKYAYQIVLITVILSTVLSISIEIIIAPDKSIVLSDEDGLVVILKKEKNKREKTIKNVIEVYEESENELFFTNKAADLGSIKLDSEKVMTSALHQIAKFIIDNNIECSYPGSEYSPKHYREPLTTEDIEYPELSELKESKEVLKVKPLLTKSKSADIKFPGASRRRNWNWKRTKSMVVDGMNRLSPLKNDGYVPLVKDDDN